MRMAADRAQPRASGQKARVAIDRAPDIGRVHQHAANRGSIPGTRATARRLVSLLQATADLAQAQPLQADPGEDQANDPRLLGNDLEVRSPAALVIGNAAVAER